jgi:transcription-repair coupling factor (superfamily II helicase)
VLAEQHYATFCDRMAAFPVRIEVLSRFRTKAQRAATRLAASKGEVDILIGTHAVLTENIPFHDLGLLIIDEEQRFGVVHKEQLKQLRALVDVLTMSATPIPRTLYLSLTGARDLSLIQTPPQNRLPVETILQPDTDAVLIKAIEDEIARGGQVYYLYNRVQTIGHVYQRLKTLLPHARILIGHGQMPPQDLAQTMRDFERGQADVLLCTTIVESGIDIPRANTILIDRADRFGLAELYQLRGRVGRSGIKAFAYLLLPTDIVLDRDARQRLQALKRHSGLGAGYAIALRDLEIRGSGNLLGAAQSGHIAAIGFGLYCQLLRRTVARLKGDQLVGIIDTEVSLEFLNTSPGAMGSNAAAIPYFYIEDEAQRMNLYRRMAEASTLGELRDLKAEITDRYGTLPPPARRTFDVAMLRIHASLRDVIKIHATQTHFTFYARLNHAIMPNFAHLPLPEGESEETWLQVILTTLQSLPQRHKRNG